MANLQSRMLHLQFNEKFFSQFLQFNQKTASNAKEEDEDKDANLGNNYINFSYFVFIK